MEGVTGSIPVSSTKLLFGLSEVLLKSIAWSEGVWTRTPVSQKLENGQLIVEAAEGSDWWRITSYGFIHDDGHALLREFPQDSSIEVSFVLNFKEQFDQCGILIRSDEENWTKAAVEFSDGHPQLGAVVTRSQSDWSTGRVSEWIGKEVTIRVSRSGDALTVRAKADEDYRLVRVAPLDSRRSWTAGPMLCAPTRAGFVATLTSWRVGESDAKLH
jgi:regulation of enolase protein 1 (concanavalin A-like superfamily)